MTQSPTRRPTDGSDADPGSVAYQAHRWGANTRTVDRWRAAGAPLHDEQEMASWLLQQKRAPAPSMRIARETLRKLGKPGELPDTDLADFEKSYTPSIADEKDNLAGIKRERAYYLFRMQRARVRRDAAAEADAAKQFRNLSDLVHDCEIRAARLGRDLGESFSAGDVDRLGHALAFWLMMGADELIGQLAKGLAEAPGPLDREAVRKIIEPMILGERVLAPLVKATKVNAPVKLPQRFVEAVKAGLAAVIEDGPTEFAALYAQPLPAVMMPAAQSTATEAAAVA